MTSRFSCLLALLLLGLAPLSAQAGKYSIGGIDDDAAVTTFLGKLQTALARDDQAAVVALVDSPLRVNFAKKPAELERAAVQKRFAEIFTPNVRKAVAGAKADDLFVNWQGVMLGEGAVWLKWSDKAKAVRIFSVNP
jgi:hypothetical protein